VLLGTPLSKTGVFIDVEEFEAAAAIATQTRTNNIMNLLKVEDDASLEGSTGVTSISDCEATILIAHAA